MKFSKYVVDMARDKLAIFFHERDAWLSYGSTEDSPKRAAYYNRRALKAMAKGVVEHDRILTNPVYY
jgi:hypothetical protein